MRITAELLLDELRNCFFVWDSHLQTGCPPLGRPLFYLPGGCVERGRLYLTERAEDALCQEDICVVYLRGSAPSKSGGSSICLAEGVEEVFNQIQEIWDRFDRWEEQMECSVLEHGDLPRMLQLSREVLGNPLLVMGMDFSLVAQAGEEELPPEQRMFGRGEDSMELFNALQQDELYNQMQENREPFLYPAHIVGWRSWNINLLQEEQPVYRLVLIEHDRPLRAGDSWLLSRLAPYVSCLLEREQSAQQSSSSLREVFSQILTDRTADYVEMSQKLSRLGWEAEHSYFCLVFKVTHLDQKNLTANLICGHIERQYPGSCSFPHQEDIVTFFNVTKGGRDLEEIAGELKYFIRESFLKAGYSRVMQGHDNLRRQYIQACTALEVGCRISPDLWIHHFNGVAFPYLLEQATRRLPGYMVCHEKLLALREHDQQQGSEYMKTLRTYLDQNLNAVQTAKELFIHRSTFLYRLDKIREILESRLDDPEELLYLSISFRLLDNEKRKLE